MGKVELHARSATGINCQSFSGTKQNLSLYGAGAKGDGADIFSELHGSGAEGFFRG